MTPVGLAAKAIIDVVVAVDDPDDEGSYLDDLVRAGYEVRIREPGHRCLRFTGGESANVHCYAPESVEIRRYLGLRDRLRVHADERAWYEATKRELAQREWKDVNYYAEAKGPVIRAILSDHPPTASAPDHHHPWSPLNCRPAALKRPRGLPRCHLRPDGEDSNEHLFLVRLVAIPRDGVASGPRVGSSMLLLI